MKNRIYTVILTLMMALGVSAQELSIKSFEPANSDLSARTNPRNDANGEPCTLVKVFVLDNITSVDGEAVGEPITKGIEKWIYLCNGVKHFKINLQNHFPVEVSFADFGMTCAESNCVYVLKIVEEKSVSNDSNFILLPSTVVNKPQDKTMPMGEKEMYLSALKYIKEGEDAKAESLALQGISKKYNKGYEILEMLYDSGYYDDNDVQKYKTWLTLMLWKKFTSKK